MYSLAEIEQAVATGAVVPTWVDQVGTIAQQRRRIEAFLDDGGSAYGFSTFLGHLDNHPMGAAESRAVFQAHLIGLPEQVDQRTAQFITATKLCQLSHGGAGVTRQLYERTVAAFAARQPVSIDLAASYGSGDVVPAAWWLASIVGRDHQFQRGDLIAMINGSFLPTGLLLAQRQQLHEQLPGALTRVQATAHAAKTGVLTSGEQPTVQLPVSLRAVEPVTAVVEAALTELDSALAESLNSPSGNPLFQVSPDSVEPRSNSSFLNFRLSLATLQVAEALRITATYQTRAISFLAALLETRPEVTLHGVDFVQLPKVAKAYLDQVAATSLGPTAYAQAESHGVEDISDAALIRARRLHQALALHAKQQRLLDSVMVSAGIG